MSTSEWVMGILLLIASVFLIVAVLLQNGKSHRLSGAISGGAETFFGKTKGKTIDKKLSKLTTVVSIIFVLMVIIVYLMQDQIDTSALVKPDTTAAIDTTADTADDTTADTSADTSADTEADTESDTSDTE